jgi:hypothetical protein
VTSGDGVLSDVQIAAMSPAQRRDLIQRLQRPLDEVFPPPVARRMRRNRLTLMVGGAIVLIPWIVYLGFTLPAKYVAHNWPATWIVFDGLLVAFMAATAGRRRGACRWCRNRDWGNMSQCDASSAARSAPSDPGH